MPLHRPSELVAFLSDLKAFPKKRLSQNFLIDGNIIQKIIAFSDIQPGDVVLEIGPGTGVITEALLNRGAFVIAIEQDPVFARALDRLQTHDQRLHVIEGDALGVDFKAILHRKAKLVANLPYHVAVAIIIKCLGLEGFFSSLTVIVQKEVAKRFLAKPCCKDYGSLTIFTRFYSYPVYGFPVVNTCFYPRPNVQSAVIQFKMKKPLQVDASLFFTMIRTAFGQRRKMMRTSLKAILPIDQIDRALQVLGKGMFVRPEELSLDEFLCFFSAMMDSGISCLRDSSNRQ